MARLEVHVGRLEFSCHQGQTPPRAQLEESFRAHKRREASGLRLCTPPVSRRERSRQRSEARDVAARAVARGRGAAETIPLEEEEGGGKTSRVMDELSQAPVRYMIELHAAMNACGQRWRAPPPSD